MISSFSIASKLYQFLGVCLILTCGGFLFYVSLEARHAEETLARTQLQVKEEQQQIAVLKAEIAHLSHPDRLEKIAQKGTFHVMKQNDFITPNDLLNSEENLILADTHQQQKTNMNPPTPQKHPTARIASSQPSQKDRFQTVLNLFTQ